MKKLILLLLVLFPLLISANTKQDTYRQGIDSYKQAKFQMALDNFLTLEKEGVVNTELFYNIGNCYYRLNQIGLSVLYYKKSLLIKSDFKPAKKNLEYVLTVTKDKQSTHKSDYIADLLYRFYNLFSVNSLALWILVILTLTVFLINYMILHKERLAFFRYISLGALILLLSVFAMMSYYKLSGLESSQEGVVLQSMVVGYSGPGESYTRLFTIHEGMIFAVSRIEGTWAQIALPNGILGWIDVNSFQRVELK